MPIVVTTPVGPALIGSHGTTLQRARQFTAREAGVFVASVADATSNTAAIIDLSAPIHSANDQDALYQDKYLYRPQAVDPLDKMRLVRIYTAALGSLAADLPYINSPAGEPFELLGTLDPQTIELAINDALRELMIEVEFTIAPTLNQTRHVLPPAIAAWLVDAAWIRQVGYLGTGELRDEVDPFDNRVVRGEVTQNTGTLYLKHPGRTFDPATTTLYVKAIAPAYFHCRASEFAAFGSKVDGLTAEADEAPVDVEWLAASALVQCWRRESLVLEQAANGRLIKDLQLAIAWKAEQTELHLLVPPLTFLPVARAWGPRQAWG